MSAKTRSEIIGDIEDYIGRTGGNFREWYVGVTGSPKTRLFGQHKLKQTGDAWISRLARDEHEAHEVADYFRSTRATKGVRSEPRDSDLYVYAYKIKSHTSP